jgi:hypothetical protein
MYLIAILLASRAAQKQSLGVAAATIGIGASELRPNSLQQVGLLRFGG